MKQIIEIEVPEGKKAVWKDSKVVFEDIKPQLPKTWGEFCKQNPINKKESYIVLNSDIHQSTMTRFERDFKADRNVLPSKQAAEAHLALMQLHQLRDCYRQGWVPNWDDENENRYYILHINTGHYIITDTTKVSMFLTFQSVEIAQEFLNNFKDLIELTGDLI